MKRWIWVVPLMALAMAACSNGTCENGVCRRPEPTGPVIVLTKMVERPR